MQKIALDPDKLRVETFVTGDAAENIQPALFTTGLNCPETNFISCARPTCRC